MESWLLTLIILFASWATLTAANMIMYNMDFDAASIFDAFALSNIVLGVPSALLFHWLENTPPPTLNMLIVLFIDIFILSYMVTGKWLLGKWCGHGIDPRYYTTETFLPLIFTWVLYVGATIMLALETNDYIDFYFVFVFLLALCRAILHIVMFLIVDDKSSNDDT